MLYAQLHAGMASQVKACKGVDCRRTRVACNVFDGLSLQAGVLAAVGVAPKPQQHCRAVVLQADCIRPLRLLYWTSIAFLPCETTLRLKPFVQSRLCNNTQWRLLYHTQTIQGSDSKVWNGEQIEHRNQKNMNQTAAGVSSCTAGQ